MNTGQMMLSLGALIFLSVIILNVNSNQLSTEETMINSKLGLIAVSLATSYLEEANARAFDLATVDNFVTDLNTLTSPSSLGPAGGEYYPNYNDFDDYNGLNRVDDVDDVPFNVKCTVVYVNATSPDTKSSNKTWNKKLTVKIYTANELMQDTIEVSSIFSYWKEI